MAEMQSIHREVEINCSPHKLLEMFRGNQPHIPNICPGKIPSIVAHHDDWTTVETTTRRWDYVIEGQSRYLIEKIEAVDEENNLMSFSIIDGDMMKTHYKSLRTTIQAVPKGEGCLVKWGMDYEKLSEDAANPEAEMDFLVALAKDIGEHHGKNV